MAFLCDLSSGYKLPPHVVSDTLVERSMTSVTVCVYIHILKNDCTINTKLGTHILYGMILARIDPEVTGFEVWCQRGYVCEYDCLGFSFHV